MILTLHILALSIFLFLFFSDHTALHMAFSPKQLMHIVSATLTFLSVWLTALQAVLVMFQDCLLKYHSTGIFVKNLPPLETMERVLFQMIKVTFILITLMLISSAYFFDDAFRFPLLSKTLLAVAAWLVFGILLIGRYYSGWRGRKATYSTLAGFLLLVLLYFGSEFIMHGDF